MTDFPTGNGDPACPKCKGRGVVTFELYGFPGGGTQNCSCVFKQDLLANVKRVWKVLPQTESASSSPLLGLTGQNLWITATEMDLRQHLRFVAFRMGPRWDARVVADATLITAWLSTAKNPRDPDVLVERKKGGPSDEFLTLVDLAVPFDLLIVRLGVKAAKNREMPGVLAEAISERMHEDKPTWIVDSPVKLLGPGHVCWDERVAELVEDWDHQVLSQIAPESQSDAPLQPPPPQGGFFTTGLASQAQLEAAAQAAKRAQRETASTETEPRAEDPEIPLTEEEKQEAADYPTGDELKQQVAPKKKDHLASMTLLKEDRPKKKKGRGK